MTPTTFEKDALQSAAGTSPRAIEVKAMEDCTVDGRSVKNTRPAVSAAGRYGLAK